MMAAGQDGFYVKIHLGRAGTEEKGTLGFIWAFQVIFKFLFQKLIEKLNIFVMLNLFDEAV